METKLMFIERFEGVQGRAEEWEKIRIKIYHVQVQILND